MCKYGKGQYTEGCTHNPQQQEHTSSFHLVEESTVKNAVIIVLDCHVVYLCKRLHVVCVERQ